jgi:hypothetical protein
MRRPADPSLRLMVMNVDAAMNTKTNDNISHGVSANARAITTDAASITASAVRIALAFRTCIIGPAPTISQTM